MEEDDGHDEQCSRKADQLPRKLRAGFLKSKFGFCVGLSIADQCADLFNQRLFEWLIGRDFPRAVLDRFVQRRDGGVAR